MSSSAPAASAQQLHAAILQYITQLQAAAAAGGAPADENGIKDAEPLEIALQCLIEATGADAKDAPKVSRKQTLTAIKRRTHSSVEPLAWRR